MTNSCVPILYINKCEYFRQLLWYFVQNERSSRNEISWNSEYSIYIQDVFVMWKDWKHVLTWAWIKYDFNLFRVNMFMKQHQRWPEKHINIKTWCWIIIITGMLYSWIGYRWQWKHIRLLYLRYLINIISFQL